MAEYKMELRKNKHSKTFRYEIFPDFKYVKTGKYAYHFEANGLSEEKVNHYKELAKENRFEFKVFDVSNLRSSNYRNDFLLAHPSGWRCRYCGKKLDSNTLTVDHMIPVHKAKSSKAAQSALRKLGADNVNSLQNLCPACEKCNRKKSTKLGWYWLPILFGDKSWYWPAVWAVRLCVAFIAVSLLVWTATRIFGV